MKLWPILLIVLTGCSTLHKERGIPVFGHWTKCDLYCDGKEGKVSHKQDGVPPDCACGDLPEPILDPEGPS